MIEKGIVKVKSIQLSVIVPVYNTAPYLDICIESILKQTFDDLEIILVDDGSTDNSGQFCDKYADIYENVICIHKKNEGACYARLNGMRIARGQYVGFVDSDDWIESQMYEVLMNEVICNNVDIITSGFLFEKGVPLVDLPQEGIYCGKERNILYRQMIYDPKVFRSGILCSVCTKIYKKNLLEKYIQKVPQNVRVWEDLAYVYLPFLEATSIQITHKAFYHYRQHDNSTSHKNDSTTFDRSVFSFQTAERLYGNCEEMVVNQLKQLGLHCLSIMIQEDLYHKPKNLAIREYGRLIKKKGQNEYYSKLYQEICGKKLYISSREAKLCSRVTKGRWLAALLQARGEEKWRNLLTIVRRMLRPLKHALKKIS